MSEERPIVAVLAGGAGSRIGGAKPAVELAGRPLIAYPLAAAKGAGLEAIVVAKLGTPLPDLTVAVVEESDPLVHPLAGVLAALEANPRRAVIALACDLPFVPAALLSELGRVEGNSAVEAAGRLQPLIARYEPATASAIRTALCRGEGATPLLERLEPRVIRGAELESFGEPEWIAFNVNTPEQLAEAESRLASLT
ncbi:molybdenum cofactor guanylyltransferase MobA [soil metagenome]